MNESSYSIRKPVFFLLSGGLLTLGTLTGLFYQEKRTVQEHNRQLIIQNDSIISVNILLHDSLRHKLPGTLPNKTAFSKPATGK